MLFFLLQFFRVTDHKKPSRSSLVLEAELAIVLVPDDTSLWSNDVKLKETAARIQMVGGQNHIERDHKRVQLSRSEVEVAQTNFLNRSISETNRK